MILLTTIVMIIVLTMLVLTLMQAVFLYIKVSNQVVSKHEALYQLEAVAHKLIMLKNDPNCIITEGDPNQMIDLLQHNRGCSFDDNQRHYRYVVDDLGLFPCLQIVSGKKKYSTHHWLITVAAVGGQDILQLRIAKQARELTCNFLEERQIHQGVISWRQVGQTHLMINMFTNYPNHDRKGVDPLELSKFPTL
jgi:hypothetical protein